MAYLASLTRLQQNVRAEVENIRRVNSSSAACRCDACQALTRLLEHLDADLREVRADVEQLIERKGEGW